ncbi:MAG: penicillin-binding protein 2 [Candidatus Aceula meridiana]|nr:penicillin-binding protein 2 [Candidatus Aceula meridiana]
MRLKIIRLVIASFFVVLGLGLIYLQIIQGQHYYNLSVNNRIRVVPIEGIRGRILDRNGIILADTRVSFDVFVVPQELEKEKEMFVFLSKTLDVDQKELEKTYKKKMIAQFVPVAIAQDISRDKAIVLEEHKFRFPGLIIQLGAKRDYPLKSIGAHVLGYVGKMSPSKKIKFKEYGYAIPKITGYSGIEEYYDSFLKGKDGGLQVEVNHRGEQVRLLGMRTPVRGQDMTLTIDSRIQKIAADCISKYIGSIVVLDLDSGEVLGMVNSPSFDPNVFVKASESNKRAKLFSDPKAPMLNRAIGGQYPPGSVFKIPLAIAALDSGKITANSTFSCNGFYSLGRRRFRCSHSHGMQNFTEAIAHSCNVYFYNVGLILGAQKIREFAHLFGLGMRTDIDLPYEEKGLIPDPDNYYKRAKRRWSKGDTLNFSIGQGDVLVTPLQVVNMMATVARDGKEIPPRLLKSAADIKKVQGYLERDINIPKPYFDLVKGGAKAAIADYAGTARVLYMKDLLVMGKTGTAQTSGKKKTHAWFAGFCPETKRKIVFCVFLEHGGSSYNACRVAKELLQSMKKQNIL